ncbi:nucleoside triphosphate pyrophosphohydrolase [Candidatus Soleaferrea massiliensis]|uniref:nucleoside triphosphate pyrophosphohydrolase n=1 Tax=Candidatus Soleaferrea massiliensis TaxID=1470354 RepID=UPI0005901EEB|nr:nucleoside triphosphate pyrophosphohydrolase [Candidatus Soleaferrea massiliensis]
MAENFTFKERYGIDDLRTIMALLRSPGGCPWDKKQDHHTIRNNFLEETYEVLEAIDQNDAEHLKEELGDVLLQVVFHAQMEQEIGSFNFDDVCDGICQKLILRHPHIFADVKADDSETVLKNWDAIKKVEKGQESATDTLLSVPKVFPSLMRSEKVQKRAARTGFDYPGVGDALCDLKSEVRELEQAIETGDRENQKEELGDLLFACVNVSRFLKTDAEEALGCSCDKFIRRFAAVERLAEEQGIDMEQASLDKLNALWAQAKKELKTER